MASMRKRALASGTSRHPPVISPIRADLGKIRVVVEADAPRVACRSHRVVVAAVSTRMPTSAATTALARPWAAASAIRVRITSRC